MTVTMDKKKESEKITKDTVINTYILGILDRRQSVLLSHSSVPDLFFPNTEFRSIA